MSKNLAFTTTAGECDGLSMIMCEELKVDGLKLLAQHKSVDTCTRTKLKALTGKLHCGRDKIDLDQHCYATMDRKHGYGRLIASDGLASLGSEGLLHALSGDDVRRIQVQDAQAQALLFIAKQHNWATPYLEELCSTERSAVLQKISPECPHQCAAEVLLHVIYDRGLPVAHLDHSGEVAKRECGANTWEPSPGVTAPFLTSLQTKLQGLSCKIKAHYPEELSKAAQLYNNSKQNSEGQPRQLTPMGLLVCSVETRMMLALAQAIHQFEWNVATLVNDSVYIWQLVGDDGKQVVQLPSTLLEAGEAAIFRDTRVTVKLKQLSMDPSYDDYVDSLEDLHGKDPFNHCTEKILTVAKKQGLIRMQDSVWEPVPGTACGYQPYSGMKSSPPPAGAA